MVIDHGKPEIRERELAKLRERLVHLRFAALHAAEQLPQTSFIHADPLSPGYKRCAMPLPLALPLGLILGMSLAWLSRLELARSEVPLILARPFLVALGLGFIVYAPVVGYFVALHGDWAYLYLLDFSRVPSAVDLVLVVLAAAHVPLGFAIATPWAIGKRGPALLKLGGALGLVLVIGCALASRRLSVSASYIQFHADFGVLTIAQTSLGRGVLLSWVSLLAAYALCARALRAPGET